MKHSRVDACLGVLVRADDFDQAVERLLTIERVHLLDLGFSPLDAGLLASAIVRAAVQKLEQVSLMRARPVATELRSYIN